MSIQHIVNHTIARNMNLSQLLAELQQLQAADSDAALALVTARKDLRGSAKSGTATANGKSSHTGDDNDPDLRRAKDLLELHKTVKLSHPDGQADPELTQARAQVAKVMSEV